MAATPSGKTISLFIALTVQEVLRLHKLVGENDGG